MAAELKQPNQPEGGGPRRRVQQQPGPASPAARGARKNNVIPMPTQDNPTGFTYRGKTRAGHDIPRRFFIPVTSPEEAQKALGDAGITVERMSARRVVGRRRNKLPNNIELAQLAEQIGDQMEAGVPIVSICESLARGHRNGVVGEALRGAAFEIRQGATIAEAFARQRMRRRSDKEGERTGEPVFPVQMVHALHIGENTAAFRDPETNREVGAMQVVMQRFADDQLKADELKSEVRGAMMYPAGLIVITSIVVVVMMYTVVPRMKELYVGATGDANAQLPALTNGVIMFSNFLQSYPGLGCVLLGILGCVLAFRWLRTDRGAAWLDRKLTFAPVFGELVRCQNAAYVLRNMALLASGQSDLKMVFGEAAKSTTHPYYREMLESVRHRYREQSTTLDVLFRPFVALMGEEFYTICLTYEKTGSIEALFVRYAKVLEKKAERRLKVVKHILERYVVLPFFAVVGLIVVAMYMPMLDILGKLAK